MHISDFPISNRTKNACIKANLTSEQDFENKYLEDLFEISGLGNKGVTELRDYLFAKFGKVFKAKPKPKKISNYKECRIVIGHFLSHKSFIAWGKEMITAKNLIEKYGLETLLSVKPYTKTGTLSFYFCEDGKKYIRQYLPSIEVEEDVVTEDSKEQEKQDEQEVKLDFNIFKKGPLSIKDFVK